MVELKTTFSKSELRWFVPLFALFGGMIGSLVRWRFQFEEAAIWIWGITAAVIMVYVFIPPWRNRIFTGWLAILFPIGWMISHLLLAIVFYLLVFPIGMLTRLFRYDPLARRFDRKAKSYWIEREKPRDARSYFRQF